MNKNYTGDGQWRLESVSKQIIRSGRKRLKLLKSLKIVCVWGKKEEEMDCSNESRR